MICEIVLALFILLIVTIVLLFLFRNKIKNYLIKKAMSQISIEDMMGGLFNGKQ